MIFHDSTSCRSFLEKVIRSGTSSIVTIEQTSCGVLFAKTSAETFAADWQDYLKEEAIKVHKDCLRRFMDLNIPIYNFEILKYYVRVL